MTETPTSRVRIMLSDPLLCRSVQQIVVGVHQIHPYAIEVEDLFQEVIVRMLVSEDQFRGESVHEFLGWVRRIAENRLIDLVRELARRPTSQQLQEELVQPRKTHKGENESQLSDLLEIAVDRFSPRDQAILRGRLAGLSYLEIARLTGAAPAAVRQAFHRIADYLRGLQ